MQVDLIVDGKDVQVRFCSSGSLGGAAYDFTSDPHPSGDCRPVMHVYPALRVKEWACSSTPLTRTQVEEAEARAATKEQEEAAALVEAQASRALDGEIWERINRNPKDTMTTEHKKYLGLPWHRWSGAIPYTTAKAILEAETQKIDGESRKGEKTMSKPNKYQPKTNNPSAEIDERDVNSFAAVLAQQPASDFRDQFTGRKMTFHAVLRAIAEINLRRAEVNMRAIDAFDSVRKEFTSVEELLQASQKLRLMDLAEQSRTAPENFRRLVPVERVGDESAPAQSND